MSALNASCPPSNAKTGLYPGLFIILIDPDIRHQEEIGTTGFLMNVNRKLRIQDCTERIPYITIQHCPEIDECWMNGHGTKHARDTN